MENNIIAVFSNRNKSMQFASYLKRMGIRNQTIDTPRELSVSCGISVVFNFSEINRAKYILNKINLNSFVGFFKIVFVGHFKKYIRI